MKKIIITAGLLLSATSAALAQSAWTTGTAADMARAGYPSPYGRSSIYALVPKYVSRHSRGFRAYAKIPHPQAGSIDDPALTGGGSAGYNEDVRRDW